ncbi:hypothetical protein ACHAXH_004650, partial [Discostella pseudostelligera]
ELHSALAAVLALPQQRRQPAVAAATTTTTTNTTMTGNGACTSTSTTTGNDDSPPELEMECNSDNGDAIVAGVVPRPIIALSPQMTVEYATSILNTVIATTSPSTSKSESKSHNATTNDSKNSIHTPPTLPLEGVIAAKFLIKHTINDNNYTDDKTQQLLNQLEKALRSSTLSFSSTSNSTSSSSITSSNNAAFAKRLERLRLHSEERSYSRLTTNIAHPAIHQSADNITVKSMTYAASVGLNMIVGPLAFGTFMYFFAGSVLNRFFLDDNNTSTAGSGGGGVDVRRVIAGVISGAFMLFVEMILFVIRSHELDASVRKKGRKAEYRPNPFGYTTKSMARTYVGE